MTLSLRYTAASDVGLLRKENQDSAYAGPHLIAVADGMGGHAHGEVASATAIATLAELDAEVPSSDLSNALRISIEHANNAIRAMVQADSSLEGMGTTLTALLYSNNRLCLAHIGDSRAYLLRDGKFGQVTKDHTLVQSMVDEGKLTPEQAEVHPQRSLLLRALGTSGTAEPDVHVHEVRPGDRWLLCSDGLSSVVSKETIRESVASGDDIEVIARRLIDLANRGGGPDNITCIIADVVDEGAYPDHPVIAGAASENRQTRRSADDSAASRAAALSPPPEEQPVAEEPPRRRRWWSFVWPVGLFIVIVLLGLGSWQWAMSQYFIGASNGKVAIFRGLSQPIGPLHVNRVENRTGIALTDLPSYERDRVNGTIEVDGRADAYAAVDRLGHEASQCVQQRRTKPTPTPSPSGTKTPTPQPSSSLGTSGGC
jgi:PPM family protein phosphatase